MGLFRVKTTVVAVGVGCALMFLVGCKPLAPCPCRLPVRPQTHLPDRDKDGIPDRLDRCPDKPEDYDGDRDRDGCPEVDPPADCIDKNGKPCLHG